MLESLDFHYDGISSLEMGLTNVRTESGLFEELFLPSRTINTMRVKGNEKSYLQSIERENISLPLTFLLPDGYSDDQVREIKRWLNQDYYKPFYFDDYPHKVFYLMYQGEPRISHNGFGQGYFTIEMVSNSPYSYSPYYTNTTIVDNSTDGIDYQFTNDGDLSLYPEMWIKITGDTHVKIVNQNTGNIFEFYDLALNETVYVDNEKEDILTDLDLTYRYDNFNENYLEIVRGVNQLKIYGQCEITFRYKYTFLI